MDPTPATRTQQPRANAASESQVATSAAPSPATVEGIVPFLRRRDYRLLKELGKGGCGKTVLLRDEFIDQLYVCKKYEPPTEAQRQLLFEHFVKEVKLLHDLSHRNVVRVYNHYLYPDHCAGYILMEYVDGLTIDKYIAQHPDAINEVFLQTIAGFCYLEQVGVLHRDVRVQNLMVRNDGVLKIIDLGFGKRVSAPRDFAKSISLNWPFDPPQEFEESRYDFATEMYFVGKLFEELIRANNLDQFKHRNVLRQMCQQSPSKRFASFRELDQQIGADRFSEIEFANAELNAYRAFAAEVTHHITKIEVRAKYNDDAERITEELAAAHRTCMLETQVPDCAMVLRCIVTGQFYYRKNGMDVSSVRGFVELMKSCGPEKRRIIMANLHTRLDAITRFDEQQELRADEIPF